MTLKLKEVKLVQLLEGERTALIVTLSNDVQYGVDMDMDMGIIDLVNSFRFLTNALDGAEDYDKRLRGLER